MLRRTDLLAKITAMGKRTVMLLLAIAAVLVLGQSCLLGPSPRPLPTIPETGANELVQRLHG